MAANNTANISVDDGIPLDFLAEMHVAMDCLPVDEEEANRIIVEKLRKEQLERNAERVRQFNSAWNIQPIVCEEPPPATSRRLVPPNSVGTGGPVLEKVSVRDPRIMARSTQSLLGDSASHQRSPYAGIVQMQPDETQHQLDAIIHERALARLHSSNAHDNGEPVYEEPEHEEPRRTERSRVPTRLPTAAQSARGAGRTRSRGHRSRRHSRSASRSPSHRRRRKHPRSRSRHRSPSYSRSRSSSRSSEHSHGTVDSRGRSSRKNSMDPAAMLQSMMAMTMQMFSPLLNGQGGGNPMALPNRVQPSYPAADTQPSPGTMIDNALQFAPAAFRNMFANQTAASAQTTQPEERTNVANDSPTVVVVEDDDEPTNQPKYDVSTELFLEGKLSFTDFLSMKPSSARSDQIAPVDAKVPKRINQAITVLEQQDTNKQTARFLYVPPTFYDTNEEEELPHQRSPLIWNSQNVLFPMTSHAKEAKLCQPFRNVNAKLKQLTDKLGLDEGIVSQQLEKVMRAATTAAVVDKNSHHNRSASDALSSAARIQAITTVPPKSGTGKVRHLIDRTVQTDGYACMQCVARNNKTFVSTATQTIPPAARKDTEVQTNGPPLGAPNVISLDGLNANQIETVDAIVRFIRTRQLAGSIESVQHALRNDRVTAAGMTPAIQHNAQRLLSQVKADMQRLEPYAAGNSHAQHHYGNNMLQQHSSSHMHMPPQYQYESQRDPRFRHHHPGSGLTRTFRTTTTTMAEQIIPAGYEGQPQMSKKLKKKLKLQQQRW